MLNTLGMIYFLIISKEEAFRKRIKKKYGLAVEKSNLKI